MHSLLYMMQEILTLCIHYYTYTYIKIILMLDLKTELKVTKICVFMSDVSSICVQRQRSDHNVSLIVCWTLVKINKNSYYKIINSMDYIHFNNSSFNWNQYFIKRSSF